MGRHSLAGSVRVVAQAEPEKDDKLKVPTAPQARPETVAGFAVDREE
jgi:hypothetical protein